MLSCFRNQRASSQADSLELLGHSNCFHSPQRAVLLKEVRWSAPSMKRCFRGQNCTTMATCGDAHTEGRSPVAGTVGGPSHCRDYQAHSSSFWMACGSFRNKCYEMGSKRLPGATHTPLVCTVKWFTSNHHTPQSHISPR